MSVLVCTVFIGSPRLHAGIVLAYTNSQDTVQAKINRSNIIIVILI